MDAIAVDRERLRRTFLELVAVDSPTGHDDPIGRVLQNPDTSHPTIEFVVPVGEESGLVGSRRLDVGQLNATHGFVLDTAAVMGSITYWSPTSVYPTVTVHGRTAHAGVEPEKGVGAIQVAADATAAMTLGRIDEETVANIGTIAGGEARNIIPDPAVLSGMARSHDRAKLDAQLAAMRQACEGAAAARGATVEFEAEEIHRTDKIAEDARPSVEASTAIRSLGLYVVARTSGGGTDGNDVNAKGIPCVALSTGMVDEHATTEHIAVDDLVLAARTLAAIATLPPPTKEQTP